VKNIFSHIQRPAGLAISPNLLCRQGVEVCLYVSVLAGKAFPVNLPIAGFRYNAFEQEDGIFCSCGRKIGIDKGGCFKMIAKAFTCTGTKRNG